MVTARLLLLFYLEASQWVLKSSLEGWLFEMEETEYKKDLPKVSDHTAAKWGGFGGGLLF